MDWKKAAKALLAPHAAVLIALLPAAAAGLVYALAYADAASPAAIAAYVPAAYTLTVWCCGFPGILRRFQSFKAENRYVKRWREDARLRMNVSLYGTLLWNAAYAVLQLSPDIWHRTCWFCSLAGYYTAQANRKIRLLKRSGGMTQ